MWILAFRSEVTMNMVSLISTQVMCEVRLNPTLSVCNKILSVIKNDVYNGSIIIFDSTKSVELRASVMRTAAKLQIPAIGYEYCLNGAECDVVEEKTNEYYVTVSESCVSQRYCVFNVDLHQIHRQYVPPSNYIPYMIRSIVRTFEMENAAVFYGPNISEKIDKCDK